MNIWICFSLVRFFNWIRIKIAISNFFYGGKISEFSSLKCGNILCKQNLLRKIRSNLYLIFPNDLRNNSLLWFSKNNLALSSCDSVAYQIFQSLSSHQYTTWPPWMQKNTYNSHIHQTVQGSTEREKIWNSNFKLSLSVWFGQI